MFSSGEEAIRVLSDELYSAVKKEVASEQKPQPTVTQTEKAPVLSPTEQQMLQSLEASRSKPLPIPNNLRETLVKLQSILEKNQKNPQLLETVKQDITFFDEVVAKRSVSFLVSHKHERYGTANWGERRPDSSDRSPSSCSDRPDRTPSTWACSWRAASRDSREEGSERSTESSGSACLAEATAAS